MGTGGVGKTTVSAAIGMAGAAAGRRMLVMTIDPARRLANAFGMPDTGNHVTRVSPEALAAVGIDGHGALSCVMPDVKGTFDDLVQRLARRDAAERILANRFYKEFSSALAGALEYAAVERLHAAYESGVYDVIVVDTPPARSAIDFLQAPRRVVDFLDPDSIAWFLKPYAAAGLFSLRLLDLGTSLILSTMGRLAGGDTVAELMEFLLGFQGLYEGFRERSQRVQALFQSADLCTVAVVAPRSGQPVALRRLQEVLHGEGITVRAVVVNRLPEAIPEGGVRLTHTSRADRDAAERILAAARAEALLAHGHRAALRAAMPAAMCVELPELDFEVHDLPPLAQLAAPLRGLVEACEMVAVRT
jgi:anion-transporting  ArsA/GET3 family ATPase